jgi:hypothetical protein
LWNNVNLRVLYGNYSLLNAWQGNGWYELSPSSRVLYLHNAQENNVALTKCETDNTFHIKKTPAGTVGAFIGEFRIFKINEIDSYG